MITIISHSEKGKTVETMKRLVVSINWGGERCIDRNILENILPDNIIMDIYHYIFV